MTTIPTNPRMLGMPRRFSEWRPGQRDATQSLLDCKARFIMQEQPTGSGKTATYMGYGLAEKHLNGKPWFRMLVLTATKALQDQIMADFGKSGVAIIKGSNAYVCLENPVVTCDKGICKSGYECPIKSECLYYSAIEQAKKSWAVITNYYYWLTINRVSPIDVLGEFDTIVMDEAHDSPGILIDSFTVEIDTTPSIGVVVPKLGPLDIDGWRSWIKNTQAEVSSKISTIVSTMRSGGRYSISKLHDLSEMNIKLQKADSISFPYWCIDTYADNKVRFAVVIPWANFGYSLWKNIPKVVITSATLTHGTANMLGINASDPSSVQFETYPSQFDPRRHPLYHVQSLSMSYRNTDDELRAKWVPTVDAICDHHVPHKGIVHTHSYDRGAKLYGWSRNRGRMILQTRSNAKEAIREFVASRGNTILLSPSVTTGYNFPGDQCRFQILSKMPFPNLMDRVVSRRSDSIRGWVEHEVAQKITQSCGRGMRDETDWCYNYITDDIWMRWHRENWNLFPISFAITYAGSIHRSQIPNIPMIQDRR